MSAVSSPRSSIRSTSPRRPRRCEALTSAEFSRRYFAGFSIELENHIGGAFRVFAPDGSLHISGEVIAHDPPRRLTVTWDVNWPGLVETLGSTLVTYDLAASGETVRLTMTQAQERDLNDDILSGGRAGWPAILSSLKSLLETGHVPAIQMEPPMRLLAALQAMGIKVPGM